MARGVSARVSSRTGQHRCCCVAMELSDAADEMSSKEMDVDSADEMSSKEMDIDSDLSLASPPPEAHDGSDCPVQGAPSSNSWRPSVDCGIYMTGRVESAEF